MYLRGLTRPQRKSVSLYQSLKLMSYFHMWEHGNSTETKRDRLTLVTVTVYTADQRTPTLTGSTKCSKLCHSVDNKMGLG